MMKLLVLLPCVLAAGQEQVVTTDGQTYAGYGYGQPFAGYGYVQPNAYMAQPYGYMAQPYAGYAGIGGYAGYGQQYAGYYGQPFAAYGAAAASPYTRRCPPHCHSHDHRFAAPCPPGCHKDHFVPTPHSVAVSQPMAAPHSLSSQHHAQDEMGNLNYGYSNINSAKQEMGNTYTGVNGAYSYIDAAGVLQRVQYVADSAGFRVADSRLPIYNPEMPVAPQDTIEVARAKEEFAAAYKAQEEAVAAVAA